AICFAFLASQSTNYASVRYLILLEALKAVSGNHASAASQKLSQLTNSLSFLFITSSQKTTGLT
ncbi:MAG TPA: hypothetical protein PLK08_09730, partial [Phycisphaerae bacterium]|nr:hypothetical protein [Phycisphaerae bacterium]